MSELLVVCVTGAESSGKTTLATALGQHFQVPVVAEFARQYFSQRSTGSNAASSTSSGKGVPYSEVDLLHIREGQRQAEEAACAAAVDRGRSVVILDTDTTVLYIWYREKFGTPPANFAPGIADPQHHYLLTRPDIPWQPDPLRENPHDRDRLHLLYRALLSNWQVPHLEVSGPMEERLRRGIAQIGSWLASP